MEQSLSDFQRTYKLHEEVTEMNTKVRRVLLAWIVMAFIGAVYICYGKSDEIIFGLRASICQLHQFAALPCCSTQARQTEHFHSWLQCLKASEMKAPRLYNYWERFNPPPFHDWPDYYPYKSAVNSNHLLLPTSPGKCPIRDADRTRSYRLLLFWMELAKKHRITWWITYGTLLGSYRHQDYIPYDHDIDVNMLEEYEPVLNQIRTLRKDFDPKYHLIWKCIGNKKIPYESIGRIGCINASRAEKLGLDDRGHM
ncbi:hypothetical protein FBUS_10939 [Fasciolopsis buskii]|uniref:LicD/FKTN/FKRP nucleotidyltransferase domain-containing protein n=1 Tax=Fasciolopsis buskii TaxID=27845 RepID=A0A8E0S2H0_9TREM|nr:hypothetical protein FBUS_10939 [Fasciolopsis buski]